MVGDGKPLVEAASPSDAAERHPSGSHRHARLTKEIQPRTAEHAWRCDDERPAVPHAAGPRRHAVDRRQPHATGPIGLDKLHHRAVGHDRADRWIDHRRQPLRLAECVGEDHARATGIAVAPPPGVDLGRNLRRALPAVDRQAERRLRHKHVARHVLKRRAGGIVMELVIAGDNPGDAAVLDPYLGRAEQVACGVERHLHAVDRHALTAAERVDR